MKLLIFSIILIAFSFIEAGTKKGPLRKSVWSEEFSYSGKPDTTKWGYDLGDGCQFSCGWGNNELQFYTRDSENVRVENGLLIIEALPKKINSSQFTSTRIVTRGKAGWLYGRFEVCAKLPVGRGTWPAIWMLPVDWKYGGWHQSGEIDIMEHVGFNQDVIHGTIHTDSYNHIRSTQVGKQISITDCSDAFHVYALVWEADKLQFFVDDRLYQTIQKKSNDTYKEWPFDQPFYLIMNVAVGGNWGGQKGVDPSIWPQRMEIDYVRVYE
jgi:beta-glucanase (GH16 family)